MVRNYRKFSNEDLQSRGEKKQSTSGCDLFKCDAAVKYRGSVLLVILSEVPGSHHECAAAGHNLPLCPDFVVL